MRTVEAEAGLQAQRVPRAQAAQPHLRVGHQLLCDADRAVVRDGQLKAVLAGVPATAYIACTNALIKAAGFLEGWG